MKSLFLSLIFLPLSGFAGSAPLKYIGKCSWDISFDFHYLGGFALAEFYLDSNTDIVYVHNFIDDDGGDFRESPGDQPDFEKLQVAGKQGLRIYSWDNGQSRVNFRAAPLNQVGLSTDSVNSLTSNENIYASCYFIAE